MRVFLVKLAGFSLYIYELQPGTLKLVYERSMKQPREYILNEEDFEDGADAFDDETVASFVPGLEASAVGLRLRLIKNNGLLKMSLEGASGGVAEWIFDGKEVMSRGCVTVSALTQTKTIPLRCSTCGEESMTRTILADKEVQSEGLTVQEVNTQIDVNQNKDSGTQYDTDVAKPLLASMTLNNKEEALDGKSKTVDYLHTSEQDQISPKNILKRKAGDFLTTQSPLHRRAKSKYDSPPWPQHLYMDCYRTTPQFEGDKG